MKFVRVTPVSDEGIRPSLLLNASRITFIEDSVPAELKHVGVNTILKLTNRIGINITETVGYLMERI